MTESLEVIALISGGKDSFYSLLHCLQNGHKVVALGNLYPSHGTAEKNEEEDLNSWMYQTVGHTVIHLYEQALGIPLYRQPIIGTAVHTGTTYGHTEGDGRSREEDEVESITPLLRRIMAAHPKANAVSTGAILSTYQRTRIESVALRLGLTPLSYLWQYPILPPLVQSSLLSDMAAIGLDARIIKVASGGLDESFLWANVADPMTIKRIEKAMSRFGVSGDGAVLGEGGEFETLVIDGPANVFKGRIVIKEENRKVVREGGGAAWLRFLSASVMMKEKAEVAEEEKICRAPGLLEERFTNTLEYLESEDWSLTLPALEDLNLEPSSSPDLFLIPSTQQGQDNTLHWTIQGKASTDDTISDQASKLISQIKKLLQESSLEPTSITSTTIILRSMSDFAAVNKTYGALFTQPNPPSRVTISCGSALPPQTNIIIHLVVHSPPLSGQEPARKALHVQSRSYWAPANIGPYSQAISIPQPLASEDSDRSWAVSIAGQIPLVPHTMIFPAPVPENEKAGFRMQTVLSLQHLVRIGLQMDVQWFTHTVAYFPVSTTSASLSSLSTQRRAMLAAKAWSHLYDSTVTESSSSDDEEEEEHDLWEQKHYASMHTHGVAVQEKHLPDHAILSSGSRKARSAPPFWAAEVQELPRAAGVEWGSGLGLVGAERSVQIYEHVVRKSFSIHQCVFANKVYSIIIIAHGKTAEVEGRLRQARDLLSLEEAVMSTASWIDVNVSGIQEGFVNTVGMVPCHSLWGSEGEKLAAVFVFETCFEKEVDSDD